MGSALSVDVTTNTVLGVAVGVIGIATIFQTARLFRLYTSLSGILPFARLK